MTLDFKRWSAPPSAHELILAEGEATTGVLAPAHHHECPSCRKAWLCHDPCSRVRTSPRTKQAVGDMAYCDEPACVEADREHQHDQLWLVAECCGTEPVASDLWTEADHAEWQRRHPSHRKTARGTVEQLYPGTTK